MNLRHAGGIISADAPKAHIYFGWAGSVKPGEAHYYRIQGKTFLIEYDHSQNPANDTTQLNPNHIHSVWRDFNGDFGRDWLGEHYKNVPHNSTKP